jgi:2-phospho-L-lactate guanylyltransferase
MTSRPFLVPVKAFSSAKARLRAAGIADAEVLAERLLRGVLLALGDSDLRIVCDSDEIEQWATSAGYPVYRAHARGLNESLTEAVSSLALDDVIIAHGDLADPSDLAAFAPGGGVTIVTDRHGRGTNVLAYPASSGFQLHFGPDSAAQHVDEARRLGLELHVISDSPWAHDVDEASDL